MKKGPLLWVSLFALVSCAWAIEDREKRMLTFDSGTLSDLQTYKQTITS